MPKATADDADQSERQRISSPSATRISGSRATSPTPISRRPLPSRAAPMRRRHLCGHGRERRHRARQRPSLAPVERPEAVQGDDHGQAHRHGPQDLRESIGRLLPGRLTVVVTRDRAYRVEGGEVAGSLDEAIRLATARARCMPAADEICIIGGGRDLRRGPAARRPALRDPRAGRIRGRYAVSADRPGDLAPRRGRGASGRHARQPCDALCRLREAGVCGMKESHGGRGSQQA